MSSLKVNEIYQLAGQTEPYQETKEHLEQIGQEQSPLAKLDVIFQALKFTVAKEIE
jgi:uncharacterized protein with ATP-grasp and redox domains